MAGIDPHQFRAFVIRPALTAIGLGGDAAEELLLGTAIQESNCGAHLAQIDGPARGPWEMEPATFFDLRNRFLAQRPSLRVRLRDLTFPCIPEVDQLYSNLLFGCAMARVKYEDAPEPLPAAGDLEAQAAYYKLHYNTPAGAATAEEYIANWRAATAPETRS